MKREDLTGKTYKEAEKLLEDEIVIFNEEISGIDDEKILNEKERVIIEEMEEYDKYLDNVTYVLPKECEYNGEKYSKNKIAAAIIYFLNKMEVEFKYTLGMHQLVNIWKSDNLKQLSHKVYDSTLRCLNGGKFKGAKEWQDILAVNEFMSKCHELYSLDLAWMIFLSTKHNTILDRVKKINETTTATIPGDEIEVPA